MTAMNLLWNSLFCGGAAGQQSGAETEPVRRAIEYHKWAVHALMPGLSTLH